jgi:hypothetical protein
MDMSGQLHTPAALHQGENTDIRCQRDTVGLSAGLRGGEEKSKFPYLESNPVIQYASSHYAG